ncbi:MAG: cell surface protein SprA, partial [Chlorobium sp.]|nr:cell surface protein SprA [Chlorobium sp.]
MIIFFAGINLGFHSPQKPQLNHEMWLDACFKTVSEEYLENLEQEEKENSVLNPDHSDDGITSLKLTKDMIIYQAPPDLGDEFEIPPSDSGEKKFLDSTLIKSDSSFISLDSTITNTDTLAAKDTVKIDWREIDSTARLEQFRYHREDEPYVEQSEKKQSKFFVQPSPTFRRRTVTIDSTGQYVEVREMVGPQESKLALRMPIDDYINMKLALKERESWEKLGYEYKLKEGKLGLGELITSFTDFEIPLPSVGVLSIFGEPKISLKIGGSVQIHGAWRSETTEGVTASRLGNTRNEPDFKQQVQINVSGTIGDKLNISADWNTERTFEYENQLKIKYTGYEDEIIQSIEAGNVSMQTPSLIGGAEALFGIKAQFKMGPFRLTALASQKKGETKEVAVSGGSTSQDYSIRAYNYSENHYFIDKAYSDRNLNLFENFYNNVPSQVNPEYQVNEIEVWKSLNQIVADQSKIRYANCFIDLPTLTQVGGAYPDSLKQPLENPIAGRSETGRFLRLTDGVDYVLHPETGYISFKTSLNDQDIIAVAFKQGTNNNTYGQFLNTVTQNDTLIVLKLVKPKNLQPQFAEAWSLKLKNIYPTGARNVKQEGFEFKILYELVGQDPTEELQTTQGNNVRLIQAFGLDKQGSGGSPTPDNIFDWRPGITILPETGEIIFPTLEPFGRDIPLGLEDKVYQKIYDTTKTFAQQDKGPDKWALSGKNTGESSAIYQLGFNVVENSVKVLLNGRELKEGVDYTVDYNIGQLTIRNDAALVPGADLKITYEQNDLFQLASKTLLGARGIYDFSDK